MAPTYECVNIYSIEALSDRHAVRSTDRPHCWFASCKRLPSSSYGRCSKGSQKYCMKHLCHRSCGPVSVPFVAKCLRDQCCFLAESNDKCIVKKLLWVPCILFLFNLTGLQHDRRGAGGLCCDCWCCADKDTMKYCLQEDDTACSHFF